MLHTHTHHSHFTQQPNPCFSSYSFLPRMDSFNSAPFPATTIDPSNTTTQQNMGHPQNVNFPDNSGQQQPLLFPATPYSLPLYDYDPNLQSFPYMHTSSSFPPVNNQPLYGYPNLYSFPVGQSGGGGVPLPLSRMQDSQVLLQQSEEDRNKMVEAQRCRIARERRRQARQRSRNSHASSVSPSVLEETIRQQQQPPLITSPDQSNVTVFTTQYTLSPCVFHAPDGKKLEEILTKKLRNSDVNPLGRIVLPKREAEERLPALWDKEGIEIVLKDVYSELRWTLKFRYWINNKSRMYVLENTGDFVKHYQLQMGDSVTLYEDEFKNLYVSTKKERNIDTDDTYNYGYMPPQQAKEEEEASLASLTKELSHRREEEEEEASSSGREDNNMASNNSTELGATEHVVGQETKETAESSSKDDQINFDEVYGDLENILDVGGNCPLFDHLTDYKT